MIERLQTPKAERDAMARLLGLTRRQQKSVEKLFLETGGSTRPAREKQARPKAGRKRS